MSKLYRHYDEAGVLLYVGVSLNALNRLSQHKESHWFHDIASVKIEGLPSREDALAAETKAIQAENPLYNIQKKYSREDLTKTEESRTQLTRRIVSFHPMYTISEAADILSTCASAVKRLIDAGKLGSVPGLGRNKRMVTGWQIIEFIEHLEASNK